MSTSTPTKRRSRGASVLIALALAAGIGGATAPTALAGPTGTPGPVAAAPADAPQLAAAAAKNPRVSVTANSNCAIYVESTAPYKIAGRNLRKNQYTDALPAVTHVTPAPGCTATITSLNGGKQTVLGNHWAKPIRLKAPTSGAVTIYVRYPA